MNCDGSDSVVMSDTKCTVPISVLRAAPFELPWGSSVFAKVMATNIFGNSIPSEAGFGAVIITKPDSPVDI
jgi:hypothetical protein